MSEKHLTESQWKALVSKTPVKDTGVQKALLAYSKVDATSDAAKALEALEEIAAQALKLKKANAALKELTTYLDEVVKEVNKTKPGLEAKVKSAATAAAATPPKAGTPKPQEPKAEAEPKEEPESGDLKERLISALKKVKASDGKESIAFVTCVAKPWYGVLLARSASERIGAPHKKELTELTKGTKFLEGKCLFEKEAHTFVVESVPAGLAKNLKKALKEYTGLTYKVRVRDLEGKVVADGDTEVDPEEATTTAAAPTAPLTASDEAKARFTMRFKALQPQILKAIGTKTPQGERIKQRAAEAGALADRSDFPQANQVLDAVETLLKTPPAAASPNQATDTEAAPRQIKLSTYMNASKDWKEAKKTAANGIFALKNAIFAACDPELKDLVKARIDQLNGILAPMDDAMIAKIQEAGSEADEERQVDRNQAVVKLARDLLDALHKHPLAAVADNNPFGTFTICSPMESVLTKFTSAFAV